MDPERMNQVEQSWVSERKNTNKKLFDLELGSAFRTLVQHPAQGADQTSEKSSRSL